ncbi:MAG TPA: 3'-5' exonuclease, partial [Candidatus Thermoplasmatota archaeon]|nr:3'-5' exonuclease [Candidatus Thermoplasmatota archaeon]
MDVLLSISNEYAYFRDQGPVRLSDLGHDPWFWAIPKKGHDPKAVHNRVTEAWKKNASGSGGYDADLSALSKIKSIGELTDVRSFVNHGEKRPAFPVYAKRSFLVPEISDELFYGHDVYTAEHDVPYQQRACVDLAASEKAWTFDTKGQKTKLKVLVYDIETTQYGKGVNPKNVPVDMIGYSEFEFSYEASKDIDKEEFQFNLVDAPPRWQDCEVIQMSARNADEEVDNLLRFIRKVPNYHIISGHNILAFDNKQVLDRVRYYIEQGDKNGNLSPNARRAFEEFGGRPLPGGKRWEAGKWAAEDRTFTFGQQNETVNFHPTSLDTYHATRRFYFFLDDFTLKKVAPFLGVVVPNRVYLAPQDIKLDD